jgi:putative PIN family toxin of toxin-antitoxin system
VKQEFERIVPDTNFLISAFLFPGSLPSLCLSVAQRAGVLLASVETFTELTLVMMRPKFDRYVDRAMRIRVLADFRATLEIIEINERVRECRDVTDDKFLELGLNGKADLILTGDQDLLTLHPWRGISILTAAGYMARGE